MKAPIPIPMITYSSDLADEVPGGRPGVAHALLHREPEVERRCAAAGPDGEDPGLDPLLERQPSEDQPADDGDRQPGAM